VANEEFFEAPEEVGGREPDAREAEARAALGVFFDQHKESVFFSRQLEVRNEGEWYHWITNRALRELAGRGLIRTEIRQLQTGGSRHLMWHKSYRYYRRDATRIVRLVEEYSGPKSWIQELIQKGGFALILKYQLYPWAHRDLARRVRTELELPVDAPRALEDGTMARFLRWHEGRGRV
jgi:hypothetical protein